MSGGNGETRPMPNSYWVDPGRFAAGEYPGALDAGEAEGKVTALLEAGIDHRPISFNDRWFYPKW